jgi:hypothetical protein
VKWDITIGWNDPNEAEAVAQALEDAATRGGKIIDQGLYDAAQEIRRQVDNVRHDQTTVEAWSRR